VYCHANHRMIIRGLFVLLGDIRLCTRWAQEAQYKFGRNCVWIIVCFRTIQFDWGAHRLLDQRLHTRYLSSSIFRPIR
jgi:hypothetical protein